MRATRRSSGALALLILGPTSPTRASRCDPHRAPAGHGRRRRADRLARRPGSARARRRLRAPPRQDPRGAPHRHPRADRPPPRPPALPARWSRTRARSTASSSEYVPFAPLRWLIVDVSRLQFRARRSRHVGRAPPRDRRPGPRLLARPVRRRPADLPPLRLPPVALRHRALVRALAAARLHELRPHRRRRGRGATRSSRATSTSRPARSSTRGKAVFLIREEGRVPYASVVVARACRRGDRDERRGRRARRARRPGARARARGRAGGPHHARGARPRADHRRRRSPSSRTRSRWSRTWC